MKVQALLQKGTALLAACLTASFCGLCCAAEEESAADEPEVKSYTSGDYTYHRLVGMEDESQKAACLDAYNGSEHDLVIPNEIDGLPVVMLGDRIFADDYYLETVTIPDSLQYIGTYSFINCTNIKEYIVKTTSENFAGRDGALYSGDCAVLYRYPVGRENTEFTVPDGTKAISSAAFACSKHLTSVVMPETLESIGASAFAECEAMESVTIPEGVKSIGEFAFNHCVKLSHVSLPQSLREIGNAAFTSTAIKDITLPSDLVSIGEQAFAATPMTEIHIPASVTDIGYTAFGWQVDQAGELFADDSFTIYGAPNSSASAYASDSYAGNKFNFIAEEQPVQTKENLVADIPDDPAEPEGMGVGRIVGIAVCGVLLVVIAAVAVVTGKKSKKGTPNDDKTD